MHRFFLTLLIATVCGCAAHPEPIIDMQGVDRVRYEKDMEDCTAYGEQIRIEEGAVKGAAAGAAVGAATGAISGDTARGAGYGAVIGTAESARLNDREKQQVVKNCMRGRGYRVLN